MRMMRAFWNGAAGGCAFVLVALLARAVDGVPTLPELAQDRLVLLLPGPVFSLLLDRFLYLGKPLLFGGLLLAQIVIGGLAGVSIARWQRLRPVRDDHRARLAVVAGGALVLWLATGAVVLPLARRGLFAGGVGVAVTTLLGFVAYAVTFAW